MKISVSLTDDDLAFLDREAEAGVYSSRSAALAAAVRLLRERDLVIAYRQSFSEWAESPDSELWETTAADGIA